MEDSLRLIVIDDSSNKTETVSNILRNAGNVIRAERVEDDEDLRDALRKDDWDLVLACPEIPYLTASQALDILKQLDKDVPLVVIADDTEEKVIDELIDAGARDFVLTSQPKRLSHTLLRETADVRNRQQLQRCEKAMQEANERAQLLVDSSRDAITYVHEGMHIFANESYLNMFGYSDPDELAGIPILNMVSKSDHEAFKKYLRDYVKGKAKENSLDVVGLKPDATEFSITMEFLPAVYEGEPCIQVIIRDQAVSEELAQKLDDMSKQDLLTGVFNRQFFLESLNNMAKKSASEGAVLYITPDNYEKTRAEIGIAASDHMLADLAGQLKALLPDEGDIIARFESERFTAILKDKAADEVQGVAAKMIKAIDDHIFDAGGHSFHTTCSIGIGLCDESMREPQEIITRAEKAANKAQSAGGNRVELYTPDASEMADMERASVVARQIKLALKNNRFTLLYQPIVSLMGDENENYEVFLRMLDEKNEEIPPSDFLDAAEKTGLMVAIDRWVLAHAIKVAATEQRNGRKLHFYIKVSGDSIKDPKLLPWLRDLLKAANIEAGALTIEVSERVAQNNLKAIKSLIDGLEMLHVRLALDHFGIAENYGNLLKHSGANVVKLDASLIQSLTSDNEVLEKVREIAAHAKEQDISSVAVAVEDPNTLATIYSTGVEYIQGYFLQPPTPNMDFDFGSMG